tara:strand:+ start:28879 stop:29214 length:336 start_codon:yes stop_codon:yes gene_type:complete
MSLYEVRFVTRILNQTDNSFPVDGFMNPSFYNDGTTVVVINTQEVAPGDSYHVEFPNCVLKGNFNIKFKDESGGINKVVLNHGMVMGPYTNPMSGAVLSEGVKASLLTCNP